MRNNEITYDTFCGGSTKLLQFYIQTVKDGVAQYVDLTNFTVNMKVYKFGLPYDVLLDKECTISTTTTGLVIYNLLPADTMDFTEGVYCVQLTLKDVGNQFTYKRVCHWYIQEKVGR